jgi:transposase InsO family protein
LLQTAALGIRRGAVYYTPRPTSVVDLALMRRIDAVHLYIPMARGFVYLAAVMDWASRRVLSWRLSITLDAAFCIAAVEEADQHRPLPHPLQHTSSPLQPR